MAKKRKGKSRNRGGNPAKAHRTAGGGGQSEPIQRGAVSATSEPRKKGGMRRPKPWETGVIAVVAILVAWGAWSWWTSRGTLSSFEDLVADGRNRLGTVQTFPDGDRNHLGAGQAFTYPTPFPVVGPHDPRPLPSGFYSRPQPNTRLLHSMEHGLVVIYYDEITGEQEETLRGFSRLFTSTWSGVIATKSPGLGSEIVVSAWRRQLRQEAFDAAPVAAFINLYTGRGPENPVR